MRGFNPSKIKDISGQRFGRLVVSGFSHRKQKAKGGGTLFWNCLCDCGGTIIVPGCHLRTGHTMSCGCLHGEGLAKRNHVHGDSATRLYRIWSGMKKRCENQACINYDHYGARGIRVCDEWRPDFPAFRFWARSHGYADNLTIDRVDNDGDYEPDNCQWLTRPQNTSKQRRGMGLPYRDPPGRT